jgi:hypothetical protein
VEDYDPTIEGTHAERRPKQLNHRRALVTGGWGRPVENRGRTNVRVVGGDRLTREFPSFELRTFVPAFLRHRALTCVPATPSDQICTGNSV